LSSSVPVVIVVVNRWYSYCMFFQQIYWMANLLCWVVAFCAPFPFELFSIAPSSRRVRRKRKHNIDYSLRDYATFRPQSTKSDSDTDSDTSTSNVCPHIDNFTALVQLVLDGDLPPKCHPSFSSNCFLALHKDPDDLEKVRPLGIGSALRRLSTASPLPWPLLSQATMPPNSSCRKANSELASPADWTSQLTPPWPTSNANPSHHPPLKRCSCSTSSTRLMPSPGKLVDLS